MKNSNKVRMIRIKTFHVCHTFSLIRKTLLFKLLYPKKNRSILCEFIIIL